jgi:hypothetical protein
MSNNPVEIGFGIGTIVRHGRQAIAVVVADRVAALADIAARHTPPGAVPHAMREFMPEWDRWRG